MKVELSSTTKQIRREQPEFERGQASHVTRSHRATCWFHSTAVNKLPMQMSSPDRNRWTERTSQQHRQGEGYTSFSFLFVLEHLPKNFYFENVGKNSLLQFLLLLLLLLQLFRGDVQLRHSLGLPLFKVDERTTQEWKDIPHKLTKYQHEQLHDFFKTNIIQISEKLFSARH